MLAKNALKMDTDEELEAFFDKIDSAAGNTPDGMINEEEVCRFVWGDWDFLCAEIEAPVEDDFTLFWEFYYVSSGSQNDFISHDSYLLKSLEKDPMADHHEVAWEFNSMDLNDDDFIDKAEALKIMRHSPNLFEFLEKAGEMFALFSSDNYVSLEEFKAIYNIMFTLDFFPEASDDTLESYFQFMLNEYKMDFPINSDSTELPAFKVLEHVREHTTVAF